MSLDLSKPVRTRDGRPVKVLTTTAKGAFPIIGYIDGTVYLALWGNAGEYYRNPEEKNDTDLVNVPTWTLSRHLPGFRALCDGEEWMRSTDGPWKEDDLPIGYRPLLEGEDIRETDQFWNSRFIGFSEDIYSKADKKACGKFHVKHRTARPLPPIKKRVPLGPEDIPPGSVVRTLGSDRWMFVTASGKGEIYTAPCGWTSYVSLCRSHEIKRPGEEWQAASKEVTEE